MSFLDEFCLFKPLTKELIRSCDPFDCGYTDLNDFFSNDCIDYSSQLLGKSYCFTIARQSSVIVCAFTISNDSIKTNFIPKPKKNKINRPIPNPKRIKSYPAALIGRLGVNKDFKRRGIGRELMDFIKSWFIDEDNKTGCRFLVVDSYNELEPLEYYQHNGFQFIFELEEEEKKYSELQPEEILSTRLMYFEEDEAING